MSGIYIHIPFCKQACTYCDFYFSVDLGRKEEFLAALSREIELRADYLNGNEIKTIYIGGGTPSVLSVMELADILKKLHETHAINAHAEVTVEVNPDDCHQGYLKSLLQAGVNRLSIGVQSFIDDELQLMNRRHSAYKAKDILRKLPEWGFQNYSADLIYAFPSQALEQLKENLNLMVDFKIPHISIYQLTYEPGTQLFYQVKKQKVMPHPDEKVLEQYEYIMDFLTSAGYDHYEISNFALPGMKSKHNASYWNGIPYLGLGPSAHSYNNHSRQWNYSSIKRYIRNVNNKQPFYDVEVLSTNDKYNEYILTALRTKWGVSELIIAEHFGEKLHQHFQREVQKFLSQDLLDNNKGIYRLTKNGKIMADTVCRELIYVD